MSTYIVGVVLALPLLVYGLVTGKSQVGGWADVLIRSWRDDQ